MGINLNTAPDALKRYLPASEKKKIGITAMTMEELLMNQKIKQERGAGGLQDLIHQYLNLRGIPFY